MLRNVDENLWVAEQPLKYFGLNVGTRMTVIRFENGDLAVISPIDVDKEMTDRLNQLGKVKSIIAPNFFHYLFLEKFKTLYPQAKLYGPSGLKVKIQDLPIDCFLEESREYFSGELEYRLFDGVNTFVPGGASPLNEYVFFHRQSQTLILTDTAFYVDENFSIAIQLAARVSGGFKQLRPSFLEQFATSDRQRVCLSAQTLLQWDFKRAIVAHGSIVEKDAKRQFREGYEWFLGQSL